MVEENIETNIYYLIGYALSAMESARDSLHTSQSNDKIFSRLNDAVDYIKKGIKRHMQKNQEDQESIYNYARESAE